MADFVPCDRLLQKAHSMGNPLGKESAKVTDLLILLGGGHSTHATGLLRTHEKTPRRAIVELLRKTTTHLHTA